MKNCYQLNIRPEFAQILKAYEPIHHQLSTFFGLNFQQSPPTQQFANVLTEQVQDNSNQQKPLRQSTQKSCQSITVLKVKENKWISSLPQGLHNLNIKNRVFRKQVKVNKILQSDQFLKRKIKKNLQDKLIQEFKIFMRSIIKQSKDNRYDNKKEGKGKLLDYFNQNKQKISNVKNLSTGVTQTPNINSNKLSCIPFKMQIKINDSNKQKKNMSGKSLKLYLLYIELQKIVHERLKDYLKCNNSQLYQDKVGQQTKFQLFLSQMQTIKQKMKQWSEAQCKKWKQIKLKVTNLQNLNRNFYNTANKSLIKQLKYQFIQKHKSRPTSTNISSAISKHLNNQHLQNQVKNNIKRCSTANLNNCHLKAVKQRQLTISVQQQFKNEVHVERQSMRKIVKKMSIFRENAPNKHEIQSQNKNQLQDLVQSKKIILGRTGKRAMTFQPRNIKLKTKQQLIKQSNLDCFQQILQRRQSCLSEDKILRRSHIKSRSSLQSNKSIKQQNSLRSSYVKVAGEIYEKDRKKLHSSFKRSSQKNSNISSENIFQPIQYLKDCKKSRFYQIEAQDQSVSLTKQNSKKTKRTQTEKRILFRKTTFRLDQNKRQSNIYDQNKRQSKIQFDENNKQVSILPKSYFGRIKSIDQKQMLFGQIQKEGYNFKTKDYKQIIDQTWKHIADINYDYLKNQSLTSSNKKLLNKDIPTKNCSYPYGFLLSIKKQLQSNQLKQNSMVKTSNCFIDNETCQRLEKKREKEIIKRNIKDKRILQTNTVSMISTQSYPRLDKILANQRDNYFKEDQKWIQAHRQIVQKEIIQISHQYQVNQQWQI